jgi:hypothetical protein
LPAESIENHGVVGDLNTVALVDMGGTIDFMCWTRLKAPLYSPHYAPPHSASSKRINKKHWGTKPNLGWYGIDPVFVR